jgi:Raf kinase inhibitor-like YbhB/YbcL family protein
MSELEIVSPAFGDGEPLPERYTCEGADISPPLAWTGIPRRAVSIVLVVVDMDAPGGLFAHWVAWNIDARKIKLDEGERPPAEGHNDFGTLGYRGPCPTPSHRPHRYSFRIRPMDCVLDLPNETSWLQVREAVKGHSLGEAVLTGTYEREIDAGAR